MNLIEIPAHSEQQAMDWSLVLVSQGIETRIERSKEDGAWMLLVDSPDYTRALQTLQEYQRENRAPFVSHEWAGSGLIFDWRSLAWFLLVIIVFVICENGSNQLRSVGIMDNSAVRSGEWWRLFTAVLLHGDLPHLAANVTIGVLLLGLAMGVFGYGLALFAAFLAGAGGNLLGFLLYSEPHRGLGASGMVMGALGLLTAQSVSLLRLGFQAKQIGLRCLLGGVFLLLLLGVNPSTDVIAHVGGFLCGGLLGGCLMLLSHRLPQNRPVNHLAALSCVALVIVTWWLALR